MINSIYDRITQYCVQNGIVAEEDVPWLRYGIEKRVATVLCGIPCFLLAVCLSDIITSISFFASFFLLRRRTGGYHAKTTWGCLAASVFIEVFFFCVVYPLLNSRSILLLNAAVAFLIFLLAPHNHPNMHLSDDEIIVLRKSARTTTLLLVSIVMLSQIIGLSSVSRGLTIGTAMAAFMLCLAYINDWRLKFETL